MMMLYDLRYWTLSADFSFDFPFLPASCLGFYYGDENISSRILKLILLFVSSVRGLIFWMIIYIITILAPTAPTSNPHHRFIKRFQVLHVGFFLFYRSD